MRATFGLLFRTTAVRWEDIRKGPSAEASLRHVRSIVDFLNDAIAAENAVHPQPDQSESTGSIRSDRAGSGPSAA